MADVIQDVGVFSVKDELVFVDEAFCYDSPEEEIICISLDQDITGENDSDTSTNSDLLPSIFCDTESSSSCTASDLDPNKDSLILNIIKNEKEKLTARNQTENVPSNITQPNITQVMNEMLIKSEADVEQTDGRKTSSGIFNRQYSPKDDIYINGNLPNSTSKHLSTDTSGDAQEMFHQMNSTDIDFSAENEMIEEKTDEEGNRNWACKHCNKMFVSRKGSVIHLRTHTGERPFSCEICFKSFIDNSTLVKHKTIHLESRPYTCSVCHKGFNQKVALQRHESTHSQHPLYRCRYCPKTFLVQSTLQAHENIHSKSKPYECNFCPSRFHTQTLQRQHERVHTNERPYKCSYCPKAFKDSGTLFKHQVIHSGVKPYTCPLCSNGFTQKVALRKHIRTHVFKNLSKHCAICNVVMNNLDELAFHLEKHIVENPAVILPKPKPEVEQLLDKVKIEPLTDLSDLATLCDVAISTSENFFAKRTKSFVSGQFVCHYCGMNFKQQKILNSHLRGIHLFCFFCSTKFSDASLLEKHHCVNQISGAEGVKKFKPGVKQFSCEKCGKRFSSRNGFVIHQRSHTGERPYSCRWCDKAFGDSATRHKHERIHTGERPFKCTNCPRAFNQRAALRAHQVTHSCNRGFSCQFCPTSFPFKTTLRKHIEANHSDELQVNCPVCGMSCVNANTLLSHINKSHVSNKPQTCSLCVSGVFTQSEEFCDHLVWHAKQQSLDHQKHLNTAKQPFHRQYSID